MVAGPIISIAMMEKQPSSEPSSPQVQGTLGGPVSINDLFGQIQRGLERSEKRKPPHEQFRFSHQFESIRSGARRSNRSPSNEMETDGSDNRSFLFGSQLRDSLLNTSYVPPTPKPAPSAQLKFEPPRFNFNFVSSASAASSRSQTPVFSAVESSPSLSDNITATTSCGEKDSTCTNKNQLLWTPTEYASSNSAPPGRSSSRYQPTRLITMPEMDSDVSSAPEVYALLKKSTDDQISFPPIRSAGVSTSRHVTGSFLSELPSSKSRSQATTLPLQESEPARDDRQFSRTRTMPLDQSWQNSSSHRHERLSAHSSADNLLNELYTDTLQQLKEPTTQDASSTTSSFGSRRAASKRRPGGNISEGSTSVNSSFRSISSSMKSTNSGLSSSVTLENDGIDTSGSLSILLASDSKRQSAGSRKSCHDSSSSMQPAMSSLKEGHSDKEDHRNKDGYQESTGTHTGKRKSDAEENYFDYSFVGPSYSMLYLGNEAEEEELDKLVALARTCIPEDKKQRYE